MSFSREKEIQTLLQRALKFTGDDLAANRQRLLSEGQKAMLRSERFWAMFIIGVIAVAISTFILFSSVPFALIVLPPVVALMICSVIHFTTEAILQHGKVESVTGIVRRSMSITAERNHSDKQKININTHYQILIGDKTFAVAKDVHDAFVESEIYTLYYIQEARILSGEMTNPAEGFERRTSQ